MSGKKQQKVLGRQFSSHAGVGAPQDGGVPEEAANDVAAQEMVREAGGEDADVDAGRDAELVGDVGLDDAATQPPMPAALNADNVRIEGSVETLVQPSQDEDLDATPRDGRRPAEDRAASDVQDGDSPSSVPRGDIEADPSNTADLTLPPASGDSAHVPGAPTVVPPANNDRRATGDPKKPPRRVSFDLLQMTVEGIRPISPKHVAVVGAAMLEGRIAIPFIVDRDLEVVDGRHRLTFLLEVQKSDPGAFAVICPDGQVPIIQRPYRSAEALDSFLLDAAKAAINLRLKPSEVEDLVLRLARALRAPRPGRRPLGEVAVLPTIDAAVGRDVRTVGRIIKRAAEREAGVVPQAPDRARAGLRSAKRALTSLPDLLGDDVAQEIQRILAAIDQRLDG